MKPDAMDPTAQLYELARVFEGLGMEVRMERLGGDGGGLCRVRGKSIVFVDLDADLETRIERCVAALARMPEAETAYLSPVLRERLEQLRGS